MPSLLYLLRPYDISKVVDVRSRPFPGKALPQFNNHLGDALKALGFEVVTAVDVNVRQMDAALKIFSDKVQPQLEEIGRAASSLVDQQNTDLAEEIGRHDLPGVGRGAVRVAGCAHAGSRIDRRLRRSVPLQVPQRPKHARASEVKAFETASRLIAFIVERMRRPVASRAARLLGVANDFLDLVEHAQSKRHLSKPKPCRGPNSGRPR